MVWVAVMLVARVRVRRAFRWTIVEVWGLDCGSMKTGILEMMELGLWRDGWLL